MAKIEAYKFINPGMATDNASEGSLVARKLVLGYNRIGKTLTGMGNVIKDIETIELARIADDKRQAIQDRRREQYERDQDAEEEQEINDLSKPDNEKMGKGRMRKLLGRSKVGKGVMNALPLWAQAIAPIFEFFLYLGSIAIIRDMMEWASKEENVKKLEVFLHKLHFVTKKFYDFFNWLVGKKILDGAAKLLGKESTLAERFSGLWDLVQAASVLSIIFAPVKSLAFITGSIGWFLKNVTTILKNKPNKKGIKPSTRTPGDGNAKNSSKTNQRLKSKTSQGGIKPKVKIDGNKITNSSLSRAPSVKGTRSNLNVKPKLRFWQEGNKWLKDGAKRQWDKLWTGTKNQIKLARAKPKAYTSNIFKSTLTKGKNLVKSPGFVSGAKTLGAGIVIDWAVDNTIVRAMDWGFDQISKKQVDNQIQKYGVDAVIKDRQKKIELEHGKPNTKWWHLGFTSNSRNYFDSERLEVYEKSLAYATEQKKKLNNRKVEPIIEKKKETSNNSFWGNLFKNKKQETKVEKKKEEKKSSGNFWSNLFGNKNSTKKNKIEKPEKKKKWWEIWKNKGGKLPQFIFGRIWKKVKKTVSSVFNGVTKAVGSVANTVGKIASNPIVGTALSFIPGMQIPMAIINGVQGIASGNMMQAFSGITGGLGAFSAIGSTAQSIVNTPDWLLNLRMSGFGQGVANAYTGASNFVSRIGAGFNNFMQTDIGKLGKSVYTGVTGGGWGDTISHLGQMTGMTKPGGLFGEGGFFGEGGRMDQFGGWMQKHHLGGLGNMFPGLSGFAASIPGFTNLPGISDIFQGQFSPSEAIGKLADRNGMGGIYKSAMGLLGGGDQVSAMRELAGELGVSPETLGAIDKGKSLYERAKSVALSEEPIELIPIIMPILQDQIVIAPEVKEKAVIVYDAANRLMNR
tara:strand:- start:2970 stop:5693 length:2724 start_codon:yes stop_codon:yes gene_type:complete